MKKCGNRSKSFPPPLINLDEFLASKRGEMCNHLIHSTKEAASESRFNLVLWNRTKEKGESTAKKLCFCPIIGLSIEEFFVLPHSLLRLNCPRASLTSTSQRLLAASSSTISKEMEFSHHDNRPFHFRRISIQSDSSSLSHQDEGLTCHLKKSPLKRKSLDHKQDKEELFKK